MPSESEPLWGRYEQLRPDQLEKITAAMPVAWWPLGLLEHHGWALPVGFDGVKADRFCERLARRHGGVVLPVMWWGADGGHGEFKWTFYQNREAGISVVDRTLRGLINFGFRAIVVYAGHYPWQGMLEKVIPPIAEENPDVLILWGIDTTLGGDEVKLPGDHAARWETAYGLALLPDLVDMDALRPHDAEGVWPESGIPPEERRHPGVSFNPADPTFAQLGEDPHRASADEAEAYLGRLEDYLMKRIHAHLAK